MTKESFIHGGAEIILAFTAVTAGLCGAFFLQFLPWADIGEVIIRLWLNN